MQRWGVLLICISPDGWEAATSQPFFYLNLSKYLLLFRGRFPFRLRYKSSIIFYTNKEKRNKFYPFNFYLQFGRCSLIYILLYADAVKALPCSALPACSVPRCLQFRRSFCPDPCRLQFRRPPRIFPPIRRQTGHEWGERGAEFSSRAGPFFAEIWSEPQIFSWEKGYDTGKGSRIRPAAFSCSDKTIIYLKCGCCFKHLKCQFNA